MLCRNVATNTWKYVSDCIGSSGTEQHNTNKADEQNKANIIRCFQTNKPLDTNGCTELVLQYEIILKLHTVDAKSVKFMTWAQK